MRYYTGSDRDSIIYDMLIKVGWNDVCRDEARLQEEGKSQPFFLDFFLDN